MEIYQGSFEVCDCVVEVFASDIYSYEISCGRVETVDAGAASSVCVDLADLPEESVFNQFPDQLGDGRDTGIEFLAEICKAVISFVYAEFEYLLFQNGILTVYSV